MILPPPTDGRQDTVFPGYLLLDDGTLQPSFDEYGNVFNPDILATPNILCKKCEVIAHNAILWLSDRIRTDPVPFYEDITTFRQSVVRGCHLCTMLWSASVVWCLQSGTTKQKKNMHRMFSNSAVFCNPKPSVLILRCFDGSAKPYLIFGDPPIPESLDLSSPAVRARLSASHASEATLEVAKTWLDDCCEDHDECSNTSDSEWRTPTRLIDVGKDPNSVLKLVQLTSHVKWVALSHCWGANHEETLKLTRSNINEMLEGFHVKKLPQLFKDCVTVTRKLGVRYLWIDSLCIIQGCPDDWAYEASRMGDVYRGSYFTIAAVSAPGNHASLFSKRHPLMMQKCLAEKTVDGQVTSIGIDSSMLYHEPLYKRGWVLQERLLAPRTLEYCSTGIGWRCRETVLRVDDAIQKAHSFGLTSSWENLLSLRAHKLSRLAPRSGQFHWTRILNAYNTADLSFEKDRPYAVKGIMATLEKETGLRVVAGVVQEFLPVALLWRVPEDGKLPDNKGVSYYTFESWKHSLAHSPSWSCAFRHRHIDYTPYETSTAEAKVKFADEPIHALEIKGNTLGRIVLQPISSIHNDSTWPSSRVTNPQNNIEERAGENANHALNSKKVSIFIPSFHSSPVMLHHVISRWVSISDVIPFFGLLLSLDFILHERMEVEFVLLSFNEEIKPFNRAAGNGLVLAKIGPDNDFWTRMGVFSMPGSAIESGRLLLAFSEKNEFLVR